MENDEYRKLVDALQQEFAQIHAAIKAVHEGQTMHLQYVRFGLSALRSAFLSAMRCHPNPDAVAEDFAKSVEHAIADTLPRDYPDSLVQRLEQEFQMMLSGLQAVATEVRQQNSRE